VKAPRALILLQNFTLLMFKDLAHYAVAVLHSKLRV